MEAKNAPVESTARVTETFEAFIAPKNVSQCNAIIIPAKAKPPKVLHENFRFSFLNFRNTKIIPVAKSIRYQTKGMASKEIKAPNTAVKPQMKTIK